MIVKVTSKHQVTFPAKVLDALGVKPGDQLEIQPGPDGFIIRPRRINPTLLAPLRGKLQSTHAPFDLHAFREQPYDPTIVSDHYA